MGRAGPTVQYAVFRLDLDGTPVPGRMQRGRGVRQPDDSGWSSELQRGAGEGGPREGPETGKGRRGGSQIGQVSGRGRFQQEAGGSVRGQQGRSRAAPDPGPGAFSCKGSRLCHFIKELCIRGKVSADLSKRQVRKAAERGRRLHDVISAFPSSFRLSGTFPRGVRGGPRPLFKHSSSALLRVTQGRGRDTLGTARPGRVGGARHTQGTAN